MSWSTVCYFTASIFHFFQNLIKYQISHFELHTEYFWARLSLEVGWGPSSTSAEAVWSGTDYSVTGRPSPRCPVVIHGRSLEPEGNKVILQWQFIHESFWFFPFYFTIQLQFLNSIFKYMKLLIKLSQIHRHFFNRMKVTDHIFCQNLKYVGLLRTYTYRSNCLY